jgi:hypothetical protein
VEVRKRKKIKYKGHKVTPREKNKRAQGGLFVFRKKRGTNNPIPDSILYTRASSLHRMPRGKRGGEIYAFYKSNNPLVKSLGK